MRGITTSSSLVFILAINVIYRGIAVKIVDVVEKCQKECGKGLLMQTGDTFDVHNCNDTCHRLLCSIGCQHWQEAIQDDNCRDVCNNNDEQKVDNPVKEMSCVIGCGLAARIYLQDVKDEVGTPPAPVLVADSQTNTSIRVRWEGANSSSIPLNVTYELQLKYDSLPGGWEYCQPRGPPTSMVQQIDNLLPYTKVKFRVAWIILPHLEPLLSTESVVISTLASGAPSSSPVITSVTSVDSTRLSVMWEPPLYPNGPIVSYVVHLHQLPDGFILIKDIPEPNAERFFIFNNLKPNTTYSVAVSCRNNVGEGPKAVRNITTLVKSKDSSTPEPFLIIGARENIFRQALGDMFNEPMILYQPSNDSVSVVGVAIHVHKRLIFLSDSMGVIHRVPMYKVPAHTPVDTIITPNKLCGLPGLLSVDWLSNKVYMTEGNQISRCDLNGQNYEVVVTGLVKTPTDMKVDPYNGFLYWVVAGFTKGGLYQVDLMDLKHKHGHLFNQDDARLLMQDDHLMTFALDLRNFRIFLPNETQNTINAVFLNRLESVDIRPNTQKPQFRGVKSIAVFHDVFYFTTGDEVFREEYHPVDDKYYHNSFAYLSAEKPFVGLNMFHPDSQPVPVPVNPIENLQAVFEETMAKLHWLPPKPLGGLGRGAWQEWRYEILISEPSGNVTFLHLNITETSHTLTNLHVATEYWIRVRAYSVGGTGPWSECFKGQTLKAASHLGFPLILWSSKDGLLKSDMIGENVELIHRATFSDFRITDIAWYDDLLFLNTNTSRVFVYNMSRPSSSAQLLSEITSSVSIAVDWLGKKIYWSNPNQQMISRSNLDGSQMEALFIFTIAKELNIDSVNGFIYWTTTHSVECARLNGNDRHTYFQTKFFYGKRVMGLTLDIDHHMVYWMVWSYNVVHLYHAPMAHYNESFPEKQENDKLAISNWTISIEELGSLPEDTMQGPLRYYSQHLYWLHDQSRALISDVFGENTAHMHGLKLNDLKTFIIIDPTLHSYPDGFSRDTISVVPTHVNDSSIIINGVWHDFNITWIPVTNVNFGKVFYEVAIDDQTSLCTVISEYPYYIYRSTASLPPYSPLTVSIRVFTYWGSSRRVIKSLRTPMSVPTEPLHPRVFVSYNRSPFSSSTQTNVTAEFRWLPPKKTNGIILGYIVTFWNGNESRHDVVDHHQEEITINSPNKTTYILRYLEANTTYFFQVRAFTKIGEGASSTIVEAKTNVEVPVPKLLVAKGDALKMADLDLHDEHSLGKELLRPVDVDYLWEDGVIFWLDEDDTLMQSDFDGTNKTKLRDLSESGNSLSVDWLGRHIYWSEGDDTSVIWKLDLNGNIEPTRIIQCSNKIRSLKVEPFSSTLLWTSEFRDGLGCLMAGNMDGTRIRPLIPNIRRCLNSANEISSKMSLTNDDKRIRRDSDVEIVEEADNEDFPSMWEYSDSDYRDAFFNTSGEPYMADQSLTSCSCPRNLIAGPAISLDITNVSFPELLWVDARKGNLWKSDLQGCHCHLIVNSSHSGDNNGLPPTSIAVDKRHIYWSNVTTGLIYSISKVPLTTSVAHGSHQGGTIASDAILSEQVPGVLDIIALGSHLQPYPDIKCLVPLVYEEPPQIFNVSSSTITLCLKPAQQLTECGQISFSSVAYTIFYSYLATLETSSNLNSLNSCDDHFPWHKLSNVSQSVCKMVVTFNTTVTLNDLQPYTQYSISVSSSNYYNKLPVRPGPIITGHTSEGAPSKPRNVQVTILTPEQAEVTWDVPQFIFGPSVKFSVHWKGLLPGADRQTFNDISRLEFEAKTNVSHYTSSFTELRPGQNYSVVVRAHTSNGSAYNSSDEVFVQMFKNPDGPVVKLINSTSAVLSWKSPNDTSIISHSLLYAELSSNTSYETAAENTRPNTKYELNMMDLHPNTLYLFKLKLVYNSSKQSTYIWPIGQYRTKGERPTPPGSPEVLRVQHDTFKVIWRDSDSRGGEKIFYILEVCYHDVDVPSKQISDWIQVYNGSETKWVITNLNPNDRYAFRVYAINEFGTGNCSEESPAISLSQIPLTESQEEQLTIVLASILPVICLLALLALCACLKIYRRRENDKKILQGMTHNLHTPDLELATLRELPHHHNFVHQNNAIYSLSDVISDVDLGGLPRISRDQIILIKFLGSGAFGEVFEGLARNLPGEDDEEATPVAIKTLRKGATDHEKAEFLKEAQLMSNFKHEHILHLLGVCLNNDPNFIILELMEGGDLLSYLRSNRPTVFSQGAVLSVQDLISICVDVAKGCRYLEEMHFVHRDLAARNCLVSSRDSAHRVVKIGDFGLARDIYKNDYYRKEGEGLLPVRWMSPESLVDGVFTSQSDVWAFGVLLWEIMTLGQQPYPARTNVEVLHYVRGGGHLDKPDNCPDDLHQLMIRCWSYNCSERPTFKYCLDQLQELKRKSADLPLTTVHNRNYLSRQDGGIVNLAYNADEACPSSPGDKNNTSRDKANFSSLRATRINSEDTFQNEEDSCFSRQGGGLEISDTSLDDKTDLLKDHTPTEAHKYLELLYDSDGYEIPLSMNESQGLHAVTSNQGTVPNFSKEEFCDNSYRNVHGADNVEFLPAPSATSNLSGSSLPPPFSEESCITDGHSDDAKRLIVSAAHDRQLDPLSKCTASQPLLTKTRGEKPSRSRTGSVASAGDADCRSCNVFGDYGGDGDANIRKTISDSVPLLKNVKNSIANHPALTFRLSSMNGKKRPASNGGIPSGGLALHHCNSWKDSSLSLGSSDASHCSSPVSPSYRSSNVSGMSALSALSGLSSSDTASSSTSGIEVDTIPVTSWC